MLQCNYSLITNSMHLSEGPPSQMQLDFLLHFSAREEKYLEEFETKGINVKTVISVEKNAWKMIAGAHLRKVNSESNKSKWKFKEFRFSFPLSLLHLLLVTDSFGAI